MKLVICKERIISFIGIMYIVIRSFGYSMYFWTENLDKSHVLVSTSNFLSTLCNVLLLILIVLLLMHGKVKIDVIVGVLFFALVTVISFVFFPDNRSGLDIVIPYFKFFAITYALIRSNCVNYRTLLNVYAVISVIVSVINITILIESYGVIFISNQYMNYSNAIGFATAIFFYMLIIERKKIYAIFAITNSIALIICSARGALLSLMLLFIILLWIQSRSKKLLAVSSVFMVLIAIVFSPFVVQWLSASLEHKGLQSLLLNDILSGNILSDSGRYYIWSALLEKASNYPFGMGICGDRSGIMSGDGMIAYAHSMLIEFIVDFGYFFGIALFTGFVLLIIKAFKSITDQKKKAFLSIFLTVSVFQLMLSRSWLTEDYLYIFLGFLTLFMEEAKKKEKGT